MPTATVIPVLIVPDVRAAVAWLTEAFGFEERLRIEAEMTISMFLRKDSHTIGAGGFKKGLRDGEIEWPNHGL